MAGIEPPGKDTIYKPSTSVPSKLGKCSACFNPAESEAIFAGRSSNITPVSDPRGKDLADAGYATAKAGAATRWLAVIRLCRF